MKDIKKKVVPKFKTTAKRIRDVIKELDVYCNPADVENIFNGIKGRPSRQSIINIVKEYSNGSINRCTECGCDIGQCNPRQLCGKTFCFSTKFRHSN